MPRTSGRDPVAAALDDASTAGHQRYQVNDIPLAAGPDPAANLRAMQALTPPYGKFGAGPYPFLFWEPSDEPTIAAVLAALQAGPSITPPFRFAINTDPVQVRAGGRRRSVRGRPHPCP